MEINDLLVSLNIKTKNLKLFTRAFTHPSYSHEHGSEEDNYNRLEYLGDSLLDLLVAEHLYLTTKLDEGMMTRIRSAFVREESLGKLATKLNFSKYVLLGRGAKIHHEENLNTILSDVFEAFCGAYYLEFGLDKLREFVKTNLLPMLDLKNTNSEFKDYKSKLQENIRLTSQKEIVYYEVDRKGPAHDLVFEFIVKHEGIILGRGQGRTKKEAEQMAAKDALRKMAV